jgi:hypothetical protein
MHIRVACNKPVLLLPVAYLEAFVVQYAYTPRASCSDMDVGGDARRSLKHCSVVKHEDSGIVVERAQIRFASRGKPHGHETQML